MARTYTVRTDSFCYDDFAAETLDAAVTEAFAGEIAGVTSVATLERKFEKYLDDGGWCWVEEDGRRVLEIGVE